jgi:hypothetical protein
VFFLRQQGQGHRLQRHGYVGTLYFRPRQNRAAPPHWHMALLPFVPEHIHQLGLVSPLNLNPVAVENKAAAEAKPAAENTPAAPSVETEVSA